MPLPRSIPQTAGALLLAGSGGAFVAAFFPQWDPSPLFGTLVPTVLFARLAVAALGLLGLGLGFLLMGYNPPVGHVLARQAPVIQAVPESHRAEPLRTPMPTQRPQTEREVALAEIDAAIRVLNRKIGKARVMLGTGKLSDDGYMKYVKGLEMEKATLERRRVHYELMSAPKGPLVR